MKIAKNGYLEGIFRRKTGKINLI